MSGSGSPGDHGTWQVICLASIGVIYLYTAAMRPGVEAGCRGGGSEALIQQTGNAIETEGRLNQTGANNI